MIEIRDLAAAYSTNGVKKTIFEGLSLNVAAGTRLSVIGPSGSGKTTFLYIVSGLKRPERGEVLFNGEPIREPRREIAIILQHYGLLPWKTVFENASLGLKIRGFSGQAVSGVVFPILKALEIGHLLDRYPKQISGGEKQRVAIARALAMSPSLLLLDEPFSSLDALNREYLQNLILSVCQQRALTLIHVTHSFEEAVFLGERVLVMKGQGHQLFPIERDDDARSPEAEADFRKSDLFHSHCNRLREYLKG